MRVKYITDKENNMTDIINQMEHPMIAELREQMEQQKSAFEQVIEERQEEIYKLTCDVDEFHTELDRLIKYNDDKKILPIKLEDLMSTIKGNRYKTQVEDIRYGLRLVLENIAVEKQQRDIVEVVPQRIVSLIKQLNNEI